MKNYAYQNSSLVNMPHEEWKDIPKLEGYFQVSNYGRIRRLAYETVYKNGVRYPEQEMIMKPYVNTAVNKYKGDSKSYLVIRLTLEGVKYDFTIARLVYNAFVAPIKLKDRSRVIFYKDNDHFNLRPANLQLATISEKQKRIKTLHRSPSPLHKLTPAERKQRQLIIAKKLSKPVSQYNLNGKQLAFFPSIATASRMTGVNKCDIGHAAKGKQFSAGYYFWAYGNVPKYDISFFSRNMKNIKHSPIYQKMKERMEKKEEVMAGELR